MATSTAKQRQGKYWAVASECQPCRTKDGHARPKDEMPEMLNRVLQSQTLDINPAVNFNPTHAKIIGAWQHAFPNIWRSTGRVSCPGAQRSKRIHAIEKTVLSLHRLPVYLGPHHSCLLSLMHRRRWAACSSKP